ncbi:MAG TPA: delta-60 repeat domain-containing protein [Anaerolineaceae bacterium]|nr:delta-60 repeat domain-containing protein [Anaerolineaceae bacterium]
MKALLQKRVRAGILAIVIALALVGSAAAAPGDLDPTFGSGGKVTTAFPVAGYVVTPVTDFNYNNATAAAFQPDGKIVVAGNFYPASHRHLRGR